MRIDSARDFGLYVRDQHRRLGMTQAGLSAAARVRRRWLSDLEAGKPTVEFGLVLKALGALDLILEAGPIEFGPDRINLDHILGDGQAAAEESEHG